MSAHLPCVLVTGATGTVGSAVVEILLQDGGYEVHAVSRSPLPDRPRLVSHVVDLSVLDFEQALAGQDYDTVVHAAQPRGTDSWTAASGDDFDLHVVRGLERLGSPRTRRWLYTSGVWIYGHQPPGKQIDETSPLRPFRAAASRLPVLAHLRREQSPPWVEVVLPSLVYGATGPLQDIARQIRQGSALAPEDMAVLWSLVERSDAAELYRRLIEDEYDERVFVVAEGESLPVCEIFRWIAGALDRPFQACPLHELRQRAPGMSFEVLTGSQPVDARLARSRLGWRPRHNFRQRVHEILGASTPQT